MKQNVHYSVNPRNIPNIDHLALRHALYVSSHYYRVESPHQHNSVVFLIKGNAKFESLSECVTVKAGECALIPEGIRYHSIWDGAPDIEFFSLCFSIHCTSKVFHQNYAMQLLPQLSSNDTYELFCDIQDLLSNKVYPDYLKAMSAVYSLYASIQPSLIIRKQEQYTQTVYNAIQYININACTNFSMSELAEHCCISESRLFHLFNEELHMSPTKYRNRVRTDKAALLLRSSDESVMNIAVECGFNSDIYFRKVFKELTGCTPLEYRSIVQQ